MIEVNDSNIENIVYNDDDDENSNDENSDNENSNDKNSDDKNIDNEDKNMKDLFTILEAEDKEYKHINIEDKLELEILLWLFKFQQKYQVSNIVLKTLIKFLNSTFKLINSKLKGFFTSLFLIKKKLEIF